MLINAIIHAKPYPYLNISFKTNTGLAWLSKVRVLKSLVQSFNEYNPLSFWIIFYSFYLFLFNNIDN
jgi:hypothetical protein